MTVMQWFRMMFWLILFVLILGVTAWIVDAAALPSGCAFPVGLGLWFATVLAWIGIRYARAGRRGSDE